MTGNKIPLSVIPGFYVDGSPVAPTQPPDKCPACGCDKYWETSDHWREFSCGYAFKVGFRHDNCTRAFSAAIQKDIQIKGLQAMREADHEQLAALRAELAEANRYAAHLEHENAALAVLHSSAVDERNAALARVAELQAVCYAAVKWRDAYIKSRTHSDYEDERTLLCTAVYEYFAVKTGYAPSEHARAQEFDSWEPGNVESETTK